MIPEYSFKDVCDVASCASQARHLLDKGEPIEEIRSWIKRIAKSNGWSDELVQHLVDITK